MNTTALPVSQAETAYDLLSEIAALALEEPLRISMNHWRVSAADMTKFGLLKGAPVCNTVGCIGGWAEVLTGRGSDRTLGLTASQRYELFYPNDLLIDADRGQGQTLAHAEKVVAHIRAFQAKYEAQLKAHTVTRS